MSQFQTVLQQTIANNTCIQVVLSKRRTTAISDAQKVMIRPMTIGEKRYYQLTSRIGKQEKHSNLSPTEIVEQIKELLVSSFLHAHLFSTEADISLKLKPDGTEFIQESKPTKQPLSTEHNRTKQYLIPENSPCQFLEEIGVMTSTGKVKAARYRKFRQINRFLELVNDIIPHLPAKGTLHVVDFGCGKSYLTFALHHLLTKIHQRTVEMIGLDRDVSVIQECKRVRQKIDCAGLRFDVGEITSHHRNIENHPVDLAVSLHACDTATDDALAKAIGWQAKVILAVPCCQHEIAQKINSSELSPLLEQGIFKERFSALATDALRLLLLEQQGYRTQAVEFIDMEHTAKNILLRAIRKEESDVSPKNNHNQLLQFKKLLGLNEIYLEQVLGEMTIDKP
ncbi:Methyltransferase [hydrothermal vent metagenome]|uniref:Methyltransferase n=1 Tax=hydrothermal vent metagenome TaxID=652676 RepID=A0A3B1E453_9ZZZZ